MAPEQIRGASTVDERADLYSFGMVVFEAVAGRIPYDAQGQMAIIASKLEKNARPLKELARASVPAGLEALLAKTLARKPGDRFATAAETRRAWRALGEATTLARVIPATDGGHGGSPPTATGMTTGTIEPANAYSSRASRMALLVAAVALVASSVVLAIALRVGPSRSAAGGGETNATSPPTSTPTPTTTPTSTTTSTTTPTSPPTPTSTSPPTSTSTPTPTPITTDAPIPPAASSAPLPLAPKPAHASRPHHPSPQGHPAPQGPHITTEPRY